MMSGKYQKGIEDYVLNAQYQTPEHVNAVIGDMLENWRQQPRQKYHAILPPAPFPERSIITA